jgi:hypothetical protein
MTAACDPSSSASRRSASEKLAAAELLSVISPICSPCTSSGIRIIERTRK